MNLVVFFAPQVEVLSHSVVRSEPVYPCCPNKVYPNLAFTVTFKQKEMFKDGKIVTKETADDGSSEEMHH